MAEEKDKLDAFLAKQKEQELQKQIRGTQGRDLSDKFLNVGLYKVIGEKKDGKWIFPTDKNGLPIVDKSKKVVVTSNEGKEKQQTSKLPLEKIIEYNRNATRGKGGASNPAHVLALV